MERKDSETWIVTIQGGEGGEEEGVKVNMGEEETGSGGSDITFVFQWESHASHALGGYYPKLRPMMCG